MGFLSSIAGAALNIGTGLLFGGPLAAVPAVQAATAAVASGAGSLLGVGPERAPGAVGTGGNGVTHRRTVVQTINNATGDVIREEMRRGAPFLMKHEIQVAKRVFKTVMKLSGKLPRKTVKESETTALKNQLTNKALTTAIESSGHHHHGNNS